MTLGLPMNRPSCSSNINGTHHVPRTVQGTIDAKVIKTDSGLYGVSVVKKAISLEHFLLIFLLPVDIKSTPHPVDPTRFTSLPCIAYHPAHSNGLPAHLVASSHPFFTLLLLSGVKL